MKFLNPVLTRIGSFADVDRVVRSLSERIVQVTGIALLNGRPIVDQPLTTAFVTVSHGLGRTPTGVFVVKNDTVATLSLIRTKNFTNTTFEVRAYSGSPTVSLWVF